MITLMLLPAFVGFLIIARPNVARSVTLLRGKWLIFVAAAFQFVHYRGWWPPELSGATERRIYAVAVVLVAVGFSWCNRSLATGRVGLLAVLFVPIGAALNSVPMAVLGAMPVSVSAARQAGYTDTELFPALPGYVHLDQVSWLWAPTADLIPVPVLMKVLSIGDLILFAGLVLLVVACGTRPSEEPPESGKSVGAEPTTAAASQPPR